MPVIKLLVLLVLMSFCCTPVSGRRFNRMERGCQNINSKLSARPRYDCAGACHR